MNPTQVWQHADTGRDIAFHIFTPRGCFAGVVDRYTFLTAPIIRRITWEEVDIWHPVPRWMRPHEVLNALP